MSSPQETQGLYIEFTRRHAVVETLEARLADARVEEARARAKYNRAKALQAVERAREDLRDAEDRCARISIDNPDGKATSPWSYGGKEQD